MTWWCLSIALAPFDMTVVGSLGQLNMMFEGSSTWWGCIGPFDRLRLLIIYFFHYFAFSTIQMYKTLHL